MPGNFTPANVPDTPTVTSLLVYPDSSTVSLTWGAVAGNGASVLGYTVTGTADSQTAVSCSTGASTYTCLIGGLKNKNTYRFTITARNTIGTSGSSETSTATKRFRSILMRWMRRMETWSDRGVMQKLAHPVRSLRHAVICWNNPNRLCSPEPAMPSKVGSSGSA